jgi:probable F420-dependent oxidoreductase
MPTTIDSPYPYTRDGKIPAEPETPIPDPLIWLAFAAAAAPTMRLGTCILIVPQRNPLVLAKELATLDHLSGGRVELGLGVGWMREEFEALGAPAFEARGRVTDEYLQAFKILWSEDAPRFDGEHVRFDHVSFLPKPVRKAVPIWVGGESPPAMRRTAKLGDVWFPIGNNPRHPLDTLARMEGGLQRLHETAEQHGRDPATIGTAYYAGWFDATQTKTLESGERHLMTGTPAQLAADIDGLAALGVKDLVLNFQRDTLERSLAAMQHFCDEIRPLVGS